MINDTKQKIIKKVHKLIKDVKWMGLEIFYWSYIRLKKLKQLIVKKDTALRK